MNTAGSHSVSVGSGITDKVKPINSKMPLLSWPLYNWPNPGKINDIKPAMRGLRCVVVFILFSSLTSTGYAPDAENKADDLIKAVIPAMENAAMPAVNISVPLVVEALAAKNWNDAH